jgi:hypothetical protein
MHTMITFTIIWLVIVSGLLAGPVAAQDKQILVVQLQGKAVGTTRPIPQVPETVTTQGNCFDVDILGLGDNIAVGTATRCLTDIRTVDGGMALTATTFFRFPNGTIVSRQRTTVQPIIDGAAEMTPTFKGPWQRAAIFCRELGLKATQTSPSTQKSLPKR